LPSYRDTIIAFIHIIFTAGIKLRFNLSEYIDLEGLLLERYFHIGVNADN